MFIYVCRIRNWAPDEQEADPNSLCAYVHEVTNNSRIGTDSILGDLYFDLVTIIPFWAFLLFRNPHDCFKCLGKDPERNYSKFQYKRAEIKRLRYRAKFGQ